MKKLSPFAGIVVLLTGLFLCPVFAHAAGTLMATQTVANFGVNDQTDTTAATQANVVQVKATRTLTVNSLPAASSTSIIGSCAITYSSTVTGGTSCSGNTVIINIASNNTAALVATALRALTGVVDNVNGHGALAITGSGTNAIFTTNGTEASSSPIYFSDASTTGAVSSTASTTGVVPVAQVNTVTIGGTVETGDQFSVTIPTGTITYTTQAGDTTLTNIANGIGAAIVASTTYSSQAFTVSTSTNTVVLTAKTAGTGFTQTSATTNVTPVAQVVTFTPSSVAGSEKYTVALNGTSYTYSDVSGLVPNIDLGLYNTLNGNSTANCANNSNNITCTAKTAGTAFTYSASTSAYGSSSGTSGVGGGGGGGGGSYTIPANHTTSTPGVSNSSPNTTTTTTSAASAASYPTGTSAKITTTLRVGSTGAGVTALQTLLAADASLGFSGTPTGYFGSKTRAAVEAFQVKYKLASPGQAGYGTVGPKTRAMLATVFG